MRMLDSEIRLERSSTSSWCFCEVTGGFGLLGGLWGIIMRRVLIFVFVINLMEQVGSGITSKACFRLCILVGYF